MASSLFSKVCLGGVLALTFLTSSHVAVSSPLAERGQASDGLTVDLGYAKYEGFYNASTGLNQFRGYVPES